MIEEDFKINNKLMKIPIISSLYKILLYIKYYKKLLRLQNFSELRFIINNYLMYYNKPNSINFFKKYVKYIIDNDYIYIKSIDNKEIFSIYFNINNIYIRLFDIQEDKSYTFASNNQKMFECVMLDYIYKDIVKIITINSLANYLEIRKGLEKCMIIVQIYFLIKIKMIFLKQYL